MSGTYTSSPGLTFEHGGSTGEPISLESAPGQTATLAGGYVYMPTGANDIIVAGLTINGHATKQVSVQIFGSEVALIGDQITNDMQHTSCIVMGYTGSVPANTLIADDTIYQCGNTADGNADQAIDLSDSTDATVTNNVIWGTAGFAIQIYPDTQSTQVTHNVIASNGYGAIFGGSSSTTSSQNTVAYNVITNSTVGMAVQQSWGGTAGTGNTFNDNCVYDNAGGNIETPDGFTTSGNVTANPDYSDAATHNYALASSSPCLAVVGYAAGTSSASVASVKGSLQESAPLAVTDGASSTARSSATLNGEVVANGHVTSWHFQYGRTTSLGSSTRYRSLSPHRSLLAARLKLSGLAPGATYHFRIVAKWSDGVTTYGSDHVFRAGGGRSTAA
jgi:hypothetical protein